MPRQSTVCVAGCCHVALFSGTRVAAWTRCSANPSSSILKSCLTSHYQMIRESFWVVGPGWNWSAFVRVVAPISRITHCGAGSVSPSTHLYKHPYQSSCDPTKFSIFPHILFHFWSFFSWQALLMICWYLCILPFSPRELWRNASIFRPPCARISRYGRCGRRAGMGGSSTDPVFGHHLVFRIRLSRDFSSELPNDPSDAAA